MTILKNNTVYEFIGLTTEIIKSTNKQIVGKTGIIINETKNMFLLKTKFGTKHISKNHNSWKFFLNNDQIVIHGNILTKRLYNRLEVSI